MLFAACVLQAQQEEETKTIVQFSGPKSSDVFVHRLLAFGFALVSSCVPVCSRAGLVAVPFGQDVPVENGGAIKKYLLRIVDCLGKCVSQLLCVCVASALPSWRSLVRRSGTKVNVRPVQGRATPSTWELQVKPALTQEDCSCVCCAPVLNCGLPM